MELAKMDYNEFLKTKQKKIIESGFDIDIKDLNPKLKKFQKYLVHSGYDPIKLMKEKISYNETRTD